ncbi:MAG: CoA transferase [Gammaproteobacteria bacterium]|nr:CoA transferase [Gammaproteobacteria bacterium]
MNDSPTGPLYGLRVIELGQLIAGPFCGQLLADLGAEVIKIELPQHGDPMRGWGRGLPVWWPIIARNKKCITLDVRTPRGQEIARDLARRADIMLENFRPGTMEKWGLGYRELRELRPEMIMVRVSGYGQAGPYAGRAGYGGIGEAMGGLRYVCGDPAVPPSRAGISIGDSLAAMFACIGCLAALRERDRSGRGQVVDSAIYESVLGVMESLVPEYTEGGRVRERTGAILPGLAPSNVYPTADGRMILIGANQDSVFRRLCEAMGQVALADDERYRTHDARGIHQQGLDELITAWTGGWQSTELLAHLENHGVPSGRIYRAPDMLADPHFQARGSIVDVGHPVFKMLKMQNVFPRLSETPGAIHWPGPDLGAHNAEVYERLLGFSREEIDDLRNSGII